MLPSPCTAKQNEAFIAHRGLYLIAGYAPGDYVCQCAECKSQFMGDKRALCCFDCATKEVEALPRRYATPRADSDEGTQTSAEVPNPAPEKPAFTGAPWSSLFHIGMPEESHGFVVSSAPDNILGRFKQIAYVVGAHHDEEAKTNARLIAASPSLYWALQDLVSSIRALARGGSCPAVLAHLADEVRHAENALSLVRGGK